MACISMPMAMMIGGGLSAAGGVASAVIGSNAAQSAAQVQAQAAQTASANTMSMFNTTQQNMTPYMNMGTNAIPQLQNLLGLGSQGAAGESAALAQTPGYQFALDQGLQATQNGYAAQGLGQSGAALKGAANYAEGLASTTYQNVVGNTQNVVNTGANAAASLGQMGLGYTNASNAALTSGAAATASGIVGSANAITSGITSSVSGLTNAFMTPLMMQSMGMYSTPQGSNNTASSSSPGMALYPGAGTVWGG